MLRLSAALLILAVSACGPATGPYGIPITYVTCYRSVPQEPWVGLDEAMDIAVQVAPATKMDVPVNALGAFQHMELTVYSASCVLEGSARHYTVNGTTRVTHDPLVYHVSIRQVRSKSDFDESPEKFGIGRGRILPAGSSGLLWAELHHVLSFSMAEDGDPHYEDPVWNKFESDATERWSSLGIR